jgi:hypothetical protein
MPFLPPTAWTTSARRLLVGAAALGAAAIAASPAAAQMACPCYASGTIRAVCARVPPAERKIDRQKKVDDVINVGVTDMVCGRYKFRATYSQTWFGTDQVTRTMPIWNRFCAATTNPNLTKLAVKSVTEAQLQACTDLLAREAAHLGLE